MTTMITVWGVMWMFYSVLPFAFFAYNLEYQISFLRFFDLLSVLNPSRRSIVRRFGLVGQIGETKSILVEIEL